MLHMRLGGQRVADAGESAAGLECHSRSMVRSGTPWSVIGLVGVVRTIAKSLDSHGTR